MKLCIYQVELDNYTGLFYSGMVRMNVEGVTVFNPFQHGGVELLFGD